MATYRDAGVDLDAADRVVAAISDAVTSTWGPHVAGSFGGFAGGFRLPNQYDDPVFMLATDGIGTKLEVARQAGRLEGVGYDLVAMVADDLAAAGATPIALTDYIAAGTLNPDEIAAIVASIAEACSSCGVALVGGETAEHPGTLPPDALDVSATALGVAEAADVPDPSSIRPGDQIVGLMSPNLRSNGFSLVRALIDDWDEIVEGRPVIDHLVEPSVIYAPAVRAARSHARAFAHITGGGLVGNLPRILGDHLDAHVDESSWQTPAIFDVIEARGVERAEMRRVFNMGIGFVVIAAADRVEEAVSTVAERGHAAQVIGEVTEGRGTVRYQSSTGVR